MDSTQKRINEIDESILSVMSTLYDLTQQVKKTNEDAELTAKLMKTLQEYLYVVVGNFRKLENILERERILKTRWKYTALTLICVCAMFTILIIMVIYGPR